MTARKGIGGHQRAYRGQSDEWLTPPDLLKAIGPFDLDPCSPVTRPWPTARCHFTVKDDGLALPWLATSSIFLNPPYGPETGKWLKKLAEHGKGVALVFARTETDMFHRWCWDCAHAMLFLRGRLHFYDLAGVRAKHNAGAPSVLVAYGTAMAQRLYACGLPGKFISLRD